jgi:hypothetical protein
MQTMSIHPYLLARLYAVQAAFEQPGFRSAPLAATTNGNPKPMANSSSIWDDLLKGKEEEEKDGSGGGTEGDSGGGTMKGLRGKNHIQAMRRLGR